MPLYLDLDIVVLFAGLMSLASLALNHASQRSRPGQPPVDLLVLSNLAILSASLGFFWREALPPGLASLVISGGALLGTLFAYRAVRLASSGAAPFGGAERVTIAVLAVQVMLGLIGDMVVAQVILASAAHGLLGLWYAHAVRTGLRLRTRRLSLLLVAPFLGLGLAYLARLVVLLAAPSAATLVIGTALVALLTGTATLAWAFSVIAIRETSGRQRDRWIRTGPRTGRPVAPDP